MRESRTSPRLLSPAVLAAFAEKGKVAAFPSRAVLITEGDESDSFFVIISGRVKVYSSNESGESIILDTYGPGEYVGELALDGHRRSASVMTIAPTRCVVVSGANLRQFIVEHPEFAQEFIYNLIHRLRQVTTSAKRLALDNVYRRVIALLHDLAQPQGAEFVVPHRMSQQDIAAHVGSSREMVSRVFAELSKGGYVRVKDREITVCRWPPERW